MNTSQRHFYYPGMYLRMQEVACAEKQEKSRSPESEGKLIVKTVKKRFKPASCAAQHFRAQEFCKRLTSVVLANCLNQLILPLS